MACKNDLKLKFSGINGGGTELNWRYYKELITILRLDCLLILFKILRNRSIIVNYLLFHYSKNQILLANKQVICYTTLCSPIIVPESHISHQL